MTNILTSPILTRLALAACLTTIAFAQNTNYSQWEPASSVDPGGLLKVNTINQDGCPILSPDEHFLFIASDRPGGKGGIDIWVAYRQRKDHPWGEPVNLPEPVNSASNDFCPTPLTGNRLFFVSTRPSDCGGGADIYETRLHPTQGWLTPKNVGCDVNSSGNEFAPSVVDVKGKTILFFSSDRQGSHDIYTSTLRANGTWGPATPVAELNTPVDDARPNVRADGLEIVFDSVRGGGASDIWTSSRPNINARWGDPIKLGPGINSSASETRASLSRDGLVLYFGSNREGGLGSSDVFSSRRWKEKAK